MATIKMQYVVQFCPKCNKRLIKIPANSVIIGSPLLTCNYCGSVYRTNLRVEWYRYEKKWLVFALPLLLAALMFVIGLFMGEPAIGVFSAIFGFIIGLCISGRDIFRMIQSKKRMRDPEYLKKLLEYGVISQIEYDSLAK